MIDEVILFLQGHLGSALRTDSVETQDLVVLPEGVISKDGLTLASNKISVLLLNVEEETVLRAADPHVRVGPNGARFRANPEIRLNLNLIFIPSFQSYADALRYLSRIITHFQNNRVLNRANAPELGLQIDQLILEFRTPTFPEQNEIWGALRIPCRPAAFFKVRMITFQARGEPSAPNIQTTQVGLRMDLERGAP